MDKLNRRSLMKWFGVGAASAAAPEVHAALIEVPGVRIVSQFPDGHQPKHFLERLKWNPFEAIWLKFWQLENNPPAWLNRGIGPLEHVLKREPTADEKAAVAGVMAWFGSNCGHCFLVEVLEASGYSVTHDSKRSEGLRNLQCGGVWPDRTAAEVTVMRHGRAIILRSGEYPELGEGNG